jgi:molecular chaperone DnaK (HSP70)
MNSKTNYFFGIDFGTTNSALVGYQITQSKSDKYGDENDRPIPSTVAIDESGNVYTGREAWEKRLQLREHCKYFHSIKTILILMKLMKLPEKFGLQ